MQNGRLGMVLALPFVVLVITSILACNLSWLLERPFKNPPSTLQEADLAGTWQAHYGFQTDDRFILRADGTFKQEYKNGEKNYVYETPWNQWSMERFSDGRIRLHLQGARYYAQGIEMGEEKGMANSVDNMPRGFYDPVSDEPIDMPHKVVLNVRSESSGNLILVHMLLSPEVGGIEPGEIFHRVEAP